METEKVAEILKRSELFSEFSDKEIHAIAEVGHVESYEAGDKIYEQGSQGEKIYLLSEGKVSLQRRVELGNNRMANVTVFILRELPQRRILGGWAALVGAAHIQMCSAICDKATRVVAVPCSLLKAVMAKNPVIRIKILEKIILLLRERIDSSYGAFETI